MKEKIIEIVGFEIEPEKAEFIAHQILDLFSLPTKYEASAEGYRIANYCEYGLKRVLRYIDDDIYYSGWMDCYDWITLKSK